MRAQDKIKWNRQERVTFYIQMQTFFQTVVKAMQINRLMNNLSCESFAFFCDFNVYLGITTHHFQLTKNALKVL